MIGLVLVVSGANERSSMDFVHNHLSIGLAFRELTVVDNLSRERVFLETDFRLISRKVIFGLRSNCAKP